MKEAAINQPNAMQLRKRQIATIFFFLYFDATVTGSGRGGGGGEVRRRRKGRWRRLKAHSTNQSGGSKRQQFRFESAHEK